MGKTMTVNVADYSDDWGTEEATVVDARPLLVVVEAAPCYWESKSSANDLNTTQVELKAV